MANITEEKMTVEKKKSVNDLPPSERGLAFSTSEESPSARDIVNYKVTQLAPEKSQETPR